MNKSYQVCTRCVMDTSASDISFDEHGVCSYCTEFLARSGHILHQDPTQRTQELSTFVAKVKAAGKDKPFRCFKRSCSVTFANRAGGGCKLV